MCRPGDNMPSLNVCFKNMSVVLSLSPRLSQICTEAQSLSPHDTEVLYEVSFLGKTINGHTNPLHKDCSWFSYLPRYQTLSSLDEDMKEKEGRMRGRKERKEGGKRQGKLKLEYDLRIWVQFNSLSQDPHLLVLYSQPLRGGPGTWQVLHEYLLV